MRSTPCRSAHRQNYDAFRRDAAFRERLEGPVYDVNPDTTGCILTTLAEARRERGISQKQMAERLGFTAVTLSALEIGKNVSASKIELYLQRLGFRLVVVPKSAVVEVHE